MKYRPWTKRLVSPVWCCCPLVDGGVQCSTQTQVLQVLRRREEQTVPGHSGGVSGEGRGPRQEVGPVVRIVKAVAGGQGERALGGVQVFRSQRLQVLQRGGERGGAQAQT